MTPLSYDKILSATVDGEKIRYGILCGNEKNSLHQSRRRWKYPRISG